MSAVDSPFGTPAQECILVLDTCVWIELIDKPSLHDVLERLAVAIRIGEFCLGVPSPVKDELGDPALQKKARSTKVQRIRSHAKEVRKAANEFGPVVSKRAADALDELEKELSRVDETIASVVDIVHELLNDRSTIEIPVSQAARDAAVQLALQNKAPFHGNKNSVADALILLSAAEYASSASNGARLEFYTLNHGDFSAKDDRCRPHADLACHFGNNLSYHCGVELLAKRVDAIDSALEFAQWLDERDEEPQRGFCFCGDATLIESASCAHCDGWIERLPDGGPFRLEQMENGERLIWIHEDPWMKRSGEEEVVRCPDCGSDELLIDLETTCPYHQHMADKDD